MLQKYSKLIAGIVGNIVGVIVIYAVYKGFGTCTSITDPNTCTVGGFSYLQLQTFAMFIINAVAIHQAPPNATGASQ